MATNVKLTQLLSLLIYNYKLDDIPFPEEKLIGDLDDIKPGCKIAITWSDPYRVEYGTVFTLPGLCEDITKGGIVQIPDIEDSPNQQCWYILKQVAILADQIEIFPSL
jgi:hypothetical protein